MYMSDIKCIKCGEDAGQASKRGAYLKRTNETGIAGVFQCAPVCEHKVGNQDDALLHAVLGY